MYSAGRQGQTDHLDLANAGLEADARGRIFVDDNFATKVDHIYAVGDVIGFPALAATSMEQGRLAAYHAFGEPTKGMMDLQPIGIYSIPEVSYVGLTEDAIPAAPSGKVTHRDKPAGSYDHDVVPGFSPVTWGDLRKDGNGPVTSKPPKATAISGDVMDILGRAVAEDLHHE